MSKGLRAFNAIAGIGMRKKGINMSACSILYWSKIVPIVTYGYETLVMSSEGMDVIRKFQRYIG